MLKELEVRSLLYQVENRQGKFEKYNSIFLLGYKIALQDVLEVKRPKAMPSIATQAV